MEFICPAHECGMDIEASFDGTEDGDPIQGHRFGCPECDHSEVALVLQYPGAGYEGVTLAPDGVDCETCDTSAEFCLERSGSYPRYRCRGHTPGMFATAMREVALELKS